MPEQLEIILTDKGQTQQPMQQGGTGYSAAPAPRAPGPDTPNVSGPKKSEVAVSDLEKGITKIAGLLGVGGLVTAAIDLRKAFNGLYESVQKNARSPDVSGDKTAAEIKSPATTPTAPKPADPPSIPQVGTFERQRAKGEVQGPPITQATRGPIPNVGWWERMQAARGGVAAPPIAGGAAAVEALPVVGPSATGSASMIGRLAAAAGPAAIAVGALAAGVAAGVVVVKKAFNAIDRESERLSGYSGELAGATARADIRSELADLRRAQRVGPQLAGYRDMTSRVETWIKDLNTNLIKFTLDAGDAIGSLPKKIADGLGEAAGELRIAAKELMKDKEGADKERAELVRIRKEAEKIRKELEENKKLDDLTDPFMAAFLDQFPGGMSRRERAKAIRAAGVK